MRQKTTKKTTKKTVNKRVSTASRVLGKVGAYYYLTPKSRDIVAANALKNNVSRSVYLDKLIRRA